MVLVDGVTFACQRCITGHRATKCGHSERELIEIQKKGRPLSQCSKCRELRATKSVHGKCECEAKEIEGELRAKKKRKNFKDVLDAAGLASAQLLSASTSPSAFSSSSYASSSNTPSTSISSSSSSSLRNSNLLNSCSCNTGTNQSGPCSSCTYQSSTSYSSNQGPSSSISNSNLSHSFTLFDAHQLQYQPIPLSQSNASTISYPLPPLRPRQSRQIVMQQQEEPCCANPPPAFQFLSLPFLSQPQSQSQQQQLPIPRIKEKAQLFIPSTLGTLSCFCGDSCSCVGCNTHDPSGRKIGLNRSNNSNLLRSVPTSSSSNASSCRGTQRIETPISAERDNCECCTGVEGNNSTNDNSTGPPPSSSSISVPIHSSLSTIPSIRLNDSINPLSPSSSNLPSFDQLLRLVNREVSNLPTSPILPPVPLPHSNLVTSSSTSSNWSGLVPNPLLIPAVCSALDSELEFEGGCGEVCVCGNVSQKLSGGSDMKEKCVCSD